MDSFKYEVKTVGGIFRLRSKKLTELEELCGNMGNEGWELVSHVVNQDLQQNNVTLHYMSFKRQGQVKVSNTFYDNLKHSADGSRGNRAALPLIA